MSRTRILYYICRILPTPFTLLFLRLLGTVSNYDEEVLAKYERVNDTIESIIVFIMLSYVFFTFLVGFSILFFLPFSWEIGIYSLIVTAFTVLYYPKILETDYGFSHSYKDNFIIAVFLLFPLIHPVLAPSIRLSTVFAIAVLAIIGNLIEISNQKYLHNKREELNSNNVEQIRSSIEKDISDDYSAKSVDERYEELREMSKPFFENEKYTKVVEEINQGKYTLQNFKSLYEENEVILFENGPLEVIEPELYVPRYINVSKEVLEQLDLWKAIEDTVDLEEVEVDSPNVPLKDDYLEISVECGGKTLSLKHSPDVSDETTVKDSDKNNIEKNVTPFKVVFDGHYKEYSSQEDAVEEFKQIYNTFKDSEIVTSTHEYSYRIDEDEDEEEEDDEWLGHGRSNWPF